MDRKYNILSIYIFKSSTKLCQMMLEREKKENTKKSFFKKSLFFSCEKACWKNGSSKVEIQTRYVSRAPHLQKEDEIKKEKKK